MKKIIRTLLVLILVLVPVTFAQAKKANETQADDVQQTSGKVTLYVFYGKTCPHCQELEAYIKNNLKKNKELDGKFDVKYYEVWYDEVNNSFLSVLGQYFNYDIKGVPLFLIGDKYYSGYGEQYNSEIESRIQDQYNNPDYLDVVAKLTKENNIALTESNPEADIPSNEEKKDESKKNDAIGYIILGVTVVILVLIIFTRRKDDDILEDEEEVVEEPKETKTTKTTAKKTTTKRKNTKK